MAWTETRQGRFERPLDSMERFHRAYGAIGHPFNREHFSMTCAVQLRMDPSFSNPAENLRQTWKTMRYLYPKIAVFVEENTCVYETPNAKQLDSWLSSTFMVESSTRTSSDLQASFRPQKLATLHYLPGSSEVLLHTAHWQTDGVGFMLFFDTFFDTLAEPKEVKFGDEQNHLREPLDRAAKVSKEKTPRIESLSTKSMTEYLANVPSIGLPILPSPLQGATRRLAIELEPAVSSEVIAKCKAQSMSVTVAIHAAVVCATQKMADPLRKADKYTTFFFFDLRKHLPITYQNRDHAFSTCHVGMPASFKPAKFASNVQELKKIYSRPFSTPDDNLFEFLPCYVEKVIHMVSQPPPPEVLPMTEGGLSSLGLIDKFLKPKYGNTEITDFWLGVEMLTAIPMIHAWTRQGRMKYNLSYNESFYSEDTATSYLREVISMLFEGLGISHHLPD